MIKIDLTEFSVVNIPEKRLSIFISLSFDAQLSIDILDVLLDYIYYDKDKEQVQKFLNQSDKVRIIRWDNFDMSIFCKSLISYVQSVPESNKINLLKECFYK